MTMRRLLYLTLALLIAGCSLSPAPTELEKNRVLWKEQNANHYQFQLSILCFCPYYSQMPLNIEVRDGEAMSIAAADGSDVTPNLEYYSQADTVEEVFGIIESAQSGGADEVMVEYDPDYGYPILIAIDYIKEAVDDEVSYQVANIQFLP
jgi:hypothetical protein